MHFCLLFTNHALLLLLLIHHIHRIHLHIHICISTHTYMHQHINTCIKAGVLLSFLLLFVCLLRLFLPLLFHLLQSAAASAVDSVEVLKLVCFIHLDHLNRVELMCVSAAKIKLGQVVVRQQLEFTEVMIVVLLVNV